MVGVACFVTVFIGRFFVTGRGHRSTEVIKTLMVKTCFSTSENTIVKNFTHLGPWISSIAARALSSMESTFFCAGIGLATGMVCGGGAGTSTGIGFL